MTSESGSLNGGDHVLPPPGFLLIPRRNRRKPNAKSTKRAKRGLELIFGNRAYNLGGMGRHTRTYRRGRCEWWERECEWEWECDFPEMPFPLMRDSEDEERPKGLVGMGK
jgi:hypothetical protein